jgi:alpha-D-ribose 1-methylphosphonate 5-triphosphate synthase subunit PhnH
VCQCIDANLAFLKNPETERKMSELMKNMPQDDMAAQIFMAKMLENELRIQDECFLQTQVEQEELEENLSFYMKDPVVGQKMQVLMSFIAKQQGGGNPF